LSNFSVRNIFNKEAWKPLPTGDGQSLSLKAQTSGAFYKSYSVSFTEPWFGGRKPNSFTFSLSYSKVNYSANNSMNSYNSPYGSSGLGGSMYSPYGSSYSPYGNGYNYNTIDPGTTYTYSSAAGTTDQIQITTALALGYGYRLSWPDDYFTLYHELSFQHYNLQNMAGYYYFLNTGNGNGNGGFNNFSLKTAFGRNSMDNPLYTRRGSNFVLSLQLTPPYSLLNGVDYSNPALTNQERYQWIEYHKWMFKGDWYSPLEKGKKLVLHTRV